MKKKLMLGVVLLFGLCLLIVPSLVVGNPDSPQCFNAPDKWYFTNITATTDNTFEISNGSIAYLTLKSQFNYDTCETFELDIDITIDVNTEIAMFIVYAYIDNGITKYTEIYLRTNNSVADFDSDRYSGFNGLMVNDTHDLVHTENGTKPIVVNGVFMVIHTFNLTTTNPSGNGTVVLNSLSIKCDVQNVNNGNPDGMLEMLIVVLFGSGAGVSAGVGVGVYASKKRGRVH